MSAGNLVPFGKYRGQPVEAMAQDQQYVEWLTQQAWFKERYQNLYTVIINNFGEPSNTPEHNALQARFLDDDFRLKFSSVAIPRLWWFARMDGEMIETAIRWAADHAGTWVVNPGDCRLQHADNWPLVVLSKVDFETGGVDVAWNVAGGILLSKKNSNEWLKGASVFRELRIEVKPEVGDDYPSILRQMRRNGSNFLFTRSYAGIGVDKQTFLQFMESQGIRVIFEHDVDSETEIRVDDFDLEAFTAAVNSVPIVPVLSPSNPKNRDSRNLLDDI